MTTSEVMAKLKEAGVSISSNGEKLWLQPATNVPADLVSVIKASKSAIIRGLELEEAERRIANRDALLEEWRRTSLPIWRGVLKEALAAGDTTRAEFAKAQLEAMGDAP